MKKYAILTKYGTKYEIDEDGCFLKYNQHNWKHPHNTWKCRGCAELRPFGRLRFHNLTNFLAMIEKGQKWTFKNGKPRFTLRDIDHGTERIHGNISTHGIYLTWKIEL